MKIKSYEKVIDKDIIAVKSYLLKIGEKTNKFYKISWQNQALYSIIQLVSYDTIPLPYGGWEGR